MVSSNGDTPHVLAVPLNDIQFAHDLLKFTLSDDLPDNIKIELDKEDVMEMSASLNVLCWVLGHENDAFEDNIKALEQALDEAGITLEYDGDDQNVNH